MSRNHPNPKIIGAFITVTLVLSLTLVIFFGTANFIRSSTHFIVFFDQSINGLNVGSAVKFRGVPIGQVRRIKIRTEGQLESSTAIPVIIEINRSRLERDFGVGSHVFELDSMRAAVERGLVAQLSLESFITGQLFVELSFEPDKLDEVQRHLETSSDFIEIPALSSSLDQITADVAQIIADVRALDLDELAGNINLVLVNAANTLEGIDSERISESITSAASEVARLAASQEFLEALVAAREALAAVRETADSFNLEAGPLSATIETWTYQWSMALESVSGLSQDASALIKPESEARFEFKNMLREISRTARAVRLFSEYLERNPNALLTGRSEEE